MPAKSAGEAPVRLEFEDHFSLRGRATDLDFRGRSVQILYGRGHQTVLEETRPPTEDGSQTVLAKRARTSGFGDDLLNGGYMLASVMLFGFVLAASAGLLLHLFMLIAGDLRARAGYGQQSDEASDVAIGAFTILAVPVFLHALSSASALAFGFVTDVWDGFLFFRMLGPWGAVASDWASYGVLVATPLVALIASLFLGAESWYRAVTLAFFFCLLALYSLYAAATVLYEVRAGLRILRDVRARRGESAEASALHVLAEAVRLRANILLSVYERRTFVQAGADVSEFLADADADGVPDAHDIPGGDVDPAGESEAARRRGGLGWWCFRKGCLGKLYVPANPRKRVWGVGQAQQTVAFATRESWLLTQLWCSSRKHAPVGVLSGPGAVTRAQLLSGAACWFITAALLLASLAALTVYAEMPAAFAAPLVVAAALLMLPRAGRALAIGLLAARASSDADMRSATLHALQQRTGSSLVPAMKNTRAPVMAAEAGDAERSLALFKVSETVRVAEPRAALLWGFVATEAVLLVLLPLASLFAARSYRLALCFLALATLSATRHVLGGRTMLREFGPAAMRAVGSGQRSAAAGVAAQRRFSLVVGRLSSRGARFCFGAVFTVMTAVLVLLLLLAASQDSALELDPASDALVVLNDFALPGLREAELPYAACQLGAGNASDLGLSDTLFLAHLAYVSDASAQPQLDAWFGVGAAQLEAGARAALTPGEEAGVAVSFKLVGFPSRSLDVVTVRGTVSAWDALSDLQLWMSAALFQAVRAVLPLGSAWTSVLPDLVYFIHTVEAEASAFRYYRLVTRFVEALRASEPARGERDVMLTGHSLGGGIALISGAQTRTRTVGVSAPNAKLSRKTFRPPVSEADLDAHTLNVIPDRDPVPMIDDPARQTQRIACRDESGRFAACHSVLRALCEVAHSCGARAALCVCAQEYGYPEPVPTGSRTFAEACT